MFTDKIADIKFASGDSQVTGGMNNPKLKEDLSYSMEKYAYAAPRTGTQMPKKPEGWDDTMHKRYLENDFSFMEDFKVWMRLAPLPKFRKLWYRMGEQMDKLEKGTIEIEVKWPPGGVDSSLKIPNLRKKIILTQQSFMGTKSYNKSLIRWIDFRQICNY